MNLLSLLYLAFFGVAFVGLPVWMIGKLKEPGWVRLLLGFNYFFLILALFLFLSTLVEGNARGERCAKNWEAVGRQLETRPAEEVIALLGEWLASEGDYSVENLAKAVDRGAGVADADLPAAHP